MKKTVLFLTIFLTIFKSYAQKLDTLITYEGNIIANITEITENEVKFKFPNENITNTLSINSISKILLNSGRILTFSQKYKTVEGGKDWQNVSIVYTETEIKGLQRQTEQISNETYNWVFGNNRKMQERSIDKLKMQTAMMGGSVIYITNQQSGMDYSLLTGFSKKADVSGIVYSNRKIGINDWEKLFEVKSSYELVKKEEFNFDTQSHIENILFSPQNVYFESIFEKEGGLYVKSKIPKKSKSDIFKVIYIDKKKIILMWKDNDRIINYILSPF